MDVGVTPMRKLTWADEFDTVEIENVSVDPGHRLRAQVLIREARYIRIRPHWRRWMLKVELHSTFPGEFDCLIGQVHRSRFGSVLREEEVWCRCDVATERRLKRAAKNKIKNRYL